MKDFFKKLFRVYVSIVIGLDVSMIVTIPESKWQILAITVISAAILVSLFEGEREISIIILSVWLGATLAYLQLVKVTILILTNLAAIVVFVLIMSWHEKYEYVDDEGEENSEEESSAE